MLDFKILRKNVIRNVPFIVPEIYTATNLIYFWKWMV